MSNLELPSRSLPAVITEAIACVSLNITSIIGNSLVCIAAYRNPKLRSTTNLYIIIALAVSDLLCATIEMPLASSTLVIGRWDFGDVVCGENINKALNFAYDVAKVPSTNNKR